MAVLLNTSLLASIFHQFPHLDFNFYNTTSVFTPDSGRYQQALLFNGIYLLFASVVLFALFSIYFLVCLCYFCASCRPQPLKPRPSKSRCLRLLICFLAVVSCGGVGLALYANNKTQDGFDQFSEAVTNVFNIFDLYQFKNKVLQRYVSGILSQLNFLNDAIHRDSRGNSSQVVIHLLQTSNAVEVELNGVWELIDFANINTQSFASIVSYYDDLRWWVTLCAHVWHALMVCVIIYSSISTQRRCSFIVLTIMADVSLFLMTSIVSVDVPISIGAADLCIHPRQSVLQYARQPGGKDVLAHYIQCPDGSPDKLLSRYYRNMSGRLDKAVQLGKSLLTDPLVQKVNNSKEAVAQVQSSIDKSINEMADLVDDLGCKRIKENYENAISTVCEEILDGLGLLILTALLISFLLIIILMCITPVWKAMSPLRPILKRDKYGVHLVTNSYQGPPGGSDSYRQLSSSIDVSYKSLEDPDEFEHVPLINKRERERPPSYRAILDSSQFMSVEEDRRISYRDDAG